MNGGEEGRNIEKVSTHKYIRPLIKKNPRTFPLFVIKCMFV